MQQKQQQIESIQESIAFQRQHLPDEGDLAQYIKMTKEDHVYCGTAQVFALAKAYDIPIRVVFDYGKAKPFEQIFNEQRKAQKPILSIAHINGNHFQFIDN